MGSYCWMGIRFQSNMTKRVLEMDVGDGYPTLWMYLIPLNCTLKNGEFYIVYFTTIKSTGRNSPAKHLPGTGWGERIDCDLGEMNLEKEENKWRNKKQSHYSSESRLSEAERCIDMLSHKGHKPPKSIISWRVTFKIWASYLTTLSHIPPLLASPCWTGFPGHPFIIRSFGRYETQQQYICIQLWEHTELRVPSGNLFWIWGYW